MTSGLGRTTTNIIYLMMLVIAIVVIYYIVIYMFGSNLREKVLLSKKLPLNGGRLDALDRTGAYDLLVSEGVGTLRAGAEYTLGFWMYINSYNTLDNKFQSILSLVDTGNLTATTGQSLLTLALFPTEPKMLVRAGMVGTTDPLLAATLENSSISVDGINATNLASTESTNMTACDVTDIDLQRWMYVSVSVNGRILDVYLDGKLARSCILPRKQDYSLDSIQIVSISPTSSFNGYISGVHFASYALAPDQIYANYQSGPYSSAGFMDFLLDKLNISIAYKGTDGASTNKTLRSVLGF